MSKRKPRKDKQVISSHIPNRNYLHQVIQAYLAGKVKSGELTHVNVYHDDNCAIFTGGMCNCKPDIEIKPDETPAKQN